MSFLQSPSRPVDWPSPDSRAGRALGWVHFIGCALSAAALSFAGWLAYAVGILAGLVVVVAAVVCLVPVAAVVALGWLLHRLARWFASC